MSHNETTEENGINHRFIAVLCFFALLCLICMIFPDGVRPLVDPVGSLVPSLKDVRHSTAAGDKTVYAFFASSVSLSVPAAIYLAMTPGLMRGMRQRMNSGRGLIGNVALTYFAGVPITVLLIGALLNIPLGQLATNSNGGLVMTALLGGGIGLFVLGPLGVAGVIGMLAIVFCAIAYPFYSIVNPKGSKK